jgi:AcrR family transcriptional regulator
MSNPSIEAILRAAEALFVRQNYGNVSMRDIARAADLTTGGLYHHFPSKEALYLAMLQADWSVKRKAMLEAVPPQGSCREKLRCLTRVYLAMPPERRSLLQLLRRDINVFKDPTRAAIIKAYQETVPAPIEAILQAGIATGEIRACVPRWLAWVYIALVETTLAPYAEATLGTLEQRLDILLDQFFFGASRGA